MNSTRTSGAAAAVNARFGGNFPPVNQQTIIEFRRREGLTQLNLARALGVTVAAIGHWEKGLREPKGASLRLIQLALRHGITRLLSEGDHD